MTFAEIKLWQAIRRRALGVKFRRQHPIGPYVVDFACLERALIVEVDGGQHAGSASDARRDHWLEGMGFRIVRFWNHEVLANLEGVLTALELELSR